MRPRPSQREANVRYYAANRQREIARVRKRQTATVEFLRTLKVAPCADCGHTFKPVQMDFDHREPGKKLFWLSKGTLKNREALLEEVAKCDLVCANCHRVRTRRLHRERLARRTSIGSGARIDEQRERWRYRADLLDQLRDVPCAVCGLSFPPCSMDFDHRDPAEKASGVTRMISHASVNRILAEVDKCDIVCANCHRLRTAERQGGRAPERE